MNIASTKKRFTLADGTEVELCLNFKRLYSLKEKRKNLYNRYNNIIMNGAKDVFDFITVLYAAYICGLENEADAMSEECFVEKMPPYQAIVVEMVKELTEPKKTTASDKLSEQEKENEIGSK